MITKLKGLYFIWGTTKDLNIGKPNNPVCAVERIIHLQIGTRERVGKLWSQFKLTKAFPVGMERKKQI